ncbi:MAG TPA: pyridoxal-5-phosphate-dependent protein subunit beta, partial [Anaerolineales bacterium]|nr:pyridoxal-5-phosphate-dependent protein subunit beta [Anaerolineales bacterium]
MTTINLTVHHDRRARAIERAREKNIIIPTYAQMKDPSKIPAKIADELKNIGLWDIHPRNLFRINWHNQPTVSGGIPSTSLRTGFGGVNFL